jgi:hypothetical protein
MADFVNNIDKINALAESNTGFVWRLQDEDGDATGIKVDSDPDMIVNLSVWEDLASLKNFVFRTQHVDFLKRKKEWFHNSAQATYVLWWVDVGHIPTLDEAMAKLNHLQRYGESPAAFSFKSQFSAVDATS